MWPRVHALYRALLALYPNGFREQLGESMLQTFKDLCREKQAGHQPFFMFVPWTFAETFVGILQENLLMIKEINPMKSILTNQNSGTILGFILMLPLLF